MKKIIPFKKEIPFKTKISEITSISLEHTLSLEDESIISGEFHISGDYKITDSSNQKEEYDYKIPFDIALDSRYDIKNATIDIDDFYYEIIDNEILKVNIDVYIEGAIMKEEPVIETSSLEDLEEDLTREEDQIDRCYDEEEIPKKIEERVKKMEEIIGIETETTNNIFNNVDSNETFETYHIYIVKENDTIESILTKYKVTREELENYNDLKEIKLGDKLIIPSTKDE